MIEVRHSIFQPESLAKEVARVFGLPGMVRCRLWRRRLSDVYLVHLSRTTYVLKVYRAGWRGRQEVEAELRFAAHLSEKGVPVAGPAHMEVGELPAPEGTRCAALYTYVWGRNLYQAASTENARQLGEITAQMHDALDDFADARCPSWGEDVLLRQPVETLANFVSKQDRTFLEQAADTLAERMQGLPEGFCHGDVDPGNAHYDGRGNCTVFDFDFCGIGPQAYDLASFFYEAHWAQWPQKMALAFLEGYGMDDAYFIDRLCPIRGIWFLGLLARNIDDWGHHELSHSFLDRHMALLRKLMKETK